MSRRDRIAASARFGQGRSVASTTIAALLSLVPISWRAA
jgi:hypothetical protein